MFTPARRSLLIGAILLLTLAFHLAVVLQDINVLAKNGFLYDDSFYAFKIARNIATGQGMSFDGLHQTNGFQPLYVFMMVPVIWLTGSNLILPIYLALIMSALFTALTAVLFYRLVYRYVGERIAMFTTFLWALSPVVTKQMANGLETSMALFLFACVVYVYLTRIRPNPRPRRRDFVYVGVLIGLAALARIDEIFLALALLLDYLLVLRKRRSSSDALQCVGLSAVCALAVFGPWLLYNVAVTGSVMQDSCAATRYLSTAYAPFLNAGAATHTPSGPSASFLWDHVFLSFAVLRIAPPVHALFRTLERLGETTGAMSVSALISNVAGLALLALFFYLVFRKNRGNRSEGMDQFRSLLFFSVLLILMYSLYVFGSFYFTRYYYPIYFVSCLYTAFFLKELFIVLAKYRPIARTMCILALGVYVSAVGFLSYSRAFRSKPVYHFYDAALWVEQNTEEDEIIGVFQAGAIGYFSNRTVINLDGKVNREALEALRERDLASYLQEEGIDVLVDISKVLDIFLSPENGGSKIAFGLSEIMGSSTSIPGWRAYRVDYTLSDTQGLGGAPASMSPSGTP
jgi:hypothetical protein